MNVSFDDNLKDSMTLLSSLPSQIPKILSFSGGKDSTLVLQLALKVGIPNLQVIHSNTLMEFPYMDEHILFCKAECDRLQVPFHYVIPTLTNRFFYSLIGKGLPAPHRTFRYCTKNMKLTPISAQIKKLFKKNPYIALNGERKNESTKRDKKLSCDGSNECGTTEQKMSVFTSAQSLVRPIFNLSTCMVWDAIAALDIAGYLEGSFNALNNIYSMSSQSSGSLRTGCIGCPLITNDKSLPMLTSSHPEYEPLTKLRDLYYTTNKIENRIMRPDQKNYGATKLGFRRDLYEKILAIEANVRTANPGFTLIQDEEKQAIALALVSNTFPRGYSQEYLLSIGAI